MAITSITRNQFQSFLDTSRGSGTYMWEPVVWSSKADFSVNPSADTKSYIGFADDQTVISSNSPSQGFDQLIQLGDPMYAFMAGLMRERPVGAAAKIPVLLVFPPLTVGATTFPAQVWDDAIIELDTWAPMDGTISYKIDYNGVCKDGTVVETNGVPVFTETTQS